MDRTPFAVLQRDATGYQRSCALTAAAELDFSLLFCATATG